MKAISIATCLALQVLAAAPSAIGADNRWRPLVISGRVLDPKGTPVTGARCLWDWSRPTRELFVEAASDGDGRFELTEPPEVANSPELRGGGTLWFLADGYAVRWQLFNTLPPASDHRREVEISLKDARPFDCLVTDPEGHPRLGELIEPVHISSSKMMMPAPRPIREWMSGTTDEEGRLRMGSLAPDQGLQVRVVSERFGTSQQNLRIAHEEPSVATLRLPRVGSIRGAIQSDRPEMFAGRKATFWSKPVEPGAPPVDGVAETTIDQHGRFEVPAIADGLVAVRIEVPANSEFGFGRQDDVHRVMAGQQTVVNLTPVRRIPITGRVVRPGGALANGEGTVRLSYDDQSPEVTIPFDRDGRFSGWTWPGGVQFRAELRMLDGLPVGRRMVVGQSTLQVDPKAKSVVVPDIELPATRIISGVALGQDDRPLVGSVIYASLGKTSGTEITTDESGRFAFVVSESTRVTSFMHRLGERTLMSFEQSGDPLVLRLRK